jgi:RND family efflux transporter MFP subunit
MSVEKVDLNDLRIDRPKTSESRRFPLAAIIGGVSVVLVAVLFLAFRRPAAAEVRVAAVEQAGSAGGRAAVLNASGYVTARRQATVSSKVTGKVTAVLIEEGMHVKRGDLLARLDASIPDAAYRLYEAQERAAASALQETRVRIAEAKLEFDRMSRLSSEDVASKADLDRARAEVDSLEARLVVQQDQLAVARRQVELQQQDVSDTEIRAPFDGIVVSKDAQPGEMISPLSAGSGFTRTGICTLVDMDSLEIEVDVNEAYINRVRADQPVEAALDAYPDWKIPAHVITVVPTADRQKATVRVRIGLDQRDPRILPDMGVKVSFIAQDEGTEKAKPPLTIPRAAMRRDGESDVVFVVQDNKVERRAIMVGMPQGERIEVASGLSAGETVVVAGPETLADGARVKVMKEKP